MSKNILVVSAHAADWVTRCGGTLLKYIKMGYIYATKNPHACVWDENSFSCVTNTSSSAGGSKSFSYT